jgi:PPK2 family polyphosphate:nucleotide phosphotransferase
MGTEVRTLLRVGSGGVDLTRIDAQSTPGVPAGSGKEWGRRELARIGTELARQQEMLYATAKTAPAGTVAARRRVLLVLQGMDCSGKGGAVRNVAGAMNPVGVRVVGFGQPTEEERAHHFLWRIKRALPPPGRVGVFDRSHYEDVLVARVRSLVPETTWRGRYDEINRWEAELVDDGLVLVKAMLHISYEEQAERLAARLADPAKHWKYNPADLDERALWSDYQAAYAEALSRCDTQAAPWYVVPADRKWYRDWAVARLLLAAFRELDLAYPPADFDVAAEQARLAAQVAGQTVG